MKPVEKQVSKVEFEQFLRKYPRPLARDVYGAVEPPLVTYNDFSLGVWPHSIVASTHLYGSPKGPYYKPEEDRKYVVVTNHEELFADKESILRHQEPEFKHHLVIVPDEVLKKSTFYKSI